MKTRDFEKIGKQLLPYLPGYVTKKNLVFKAPIGDLLCGLSFERCTDGKYFHLSVFFLPCFVLTDIVYFNYGKRIGNALNWRADNPNLLSDLKEAICNQALPFLKSVSTLTEVANHLKAEVELDRRRVNSHTLEALACTLIKTGDYPAALETLSELTQKLENEIVPWMVAQRSRARFIKDNLLQNPEAALAQLEAWKTETICNLGLENPS